MNAGKNKLFLVFLAVLLFALMIRTVYFSKQWSVWWDEVVYLAMADAFAGNNYFFEYFRPPLLPFLLYVFGAFFGVSVFSGKIFSFLTSIATVVVFYLLLEKIIGKGKALIASFLFAINYYSIFYSTRILSESPTVLFNLLALGFFYLAYEKNSIRYAALSGVFIGLGMMTKHMSAYFVFAVLFYLFITTRLKFLRDKRIYIIGLLTLLVLSPWLVFNYVKFGNPFWPQLQNIGMSPPEGILFYPIIFPIFLGVQGIFLLFSLSLKKIRSDKFLLLNWLTIVAGLVVLSLVAHKEDRFMMVFLPSIAILESIGFYNFLNMLNRKARKNVAVLICVALSIFYIAVFVQAPNEYEDLIYKCNDLVKTLPNETMSSTMSPYFSYFNKRFFEQLPWDSRDFSCNNLMAGGKNYTIYYSAGWYQPIEKDFLSAAQDCVELLHNITENQKCLVFRIRR